MRTPFVVGNWKLHKTIAEALALVTELKNQLAAVKGVAVGVAPVFTALSPVARRLGESRIALAAQDCFWEDHGAWTGEVSPALLADAGCTWVIVGHSERRHHFGETDDAVGKKAAAVLAAGLGVIVCVGETDAQRDAGATTAVVDQQLAGALDGLDRGRPRADRHRLRAGVGDRHRADRDPGTGPGGPRPHPEPAGRALGRRRGRRRSASSTAARSSRATPRP